MCPVMVCRDPRGQWCLDMLYLNDNNFLISDFKMNVILLNSDASNEHRGKVFKVRYCPI